MSKVTRSVLADALRLAPDARAELAAELLASLDGPEDQDAQAEWAAEIDRRIEAIEAGTAALEPWDDVKHRVALHSALGRSEADVSTGRVVDAAVVLRGLKAR